MKSFIALAIAAITNAIETENNFKFMQFVSKFAKNYDTVEEWMARMKNWLEVEKVIEAHNATESSYKLGHNKFSDWSVEEWEGLQTYKQDSAKVIPYTNEITPNVTATPIDWREHNAVNPVKDQGSCGSCWAFSTITTLESAHAIKSGTLLSFAEQQLVDCDINDSNKGCDGGDVDVAYKYFYEHNTILEASYLYTAVDGTCQYDSLANTGINVVGYTGVQRNSPDAMKSSLGQQPIKVGVHASDTSFRSYTSGIYNNTACGY